ncbi:MAG: cytochrome c, partial [Nitrospirota bacterium]
MKLILWAGAIVGAIALVVLLVMVGGLLPPQTIKLVEGYMPMQLLAELAFFVGVFALMSYLLKKNGLGIPRFWQGISFWIFIILYLKYRIYPPIPFSVLA